MTAFCQGSVIKLVRFYHPKTPITHHQVPSIVSSKYLLTWPAFPTLLPTTDPAMAPALTTLTSSPALPPERSFPGTGATERPYDFDYIEL